MYRLITNIFFVILMIALPSMAEAQKRIALVIGNGEYDSVGNLSNPPNDARLMARTLRDLNFEVIEQIDATQKSLKRAVRNFGKLIETGGDDAIALFYYAGHGVQVKGANYIIPVDAEIDNEGDVDIEAIDMNAILSLMEYSGAGLNFVILDACRNNPFSRGFRSATRGLAEMNAPTGSFIAYATSPGDVAADGDGENSPYTEALAKAMQEPGVSVEHMFKKVRNTVRQATNNEQTPWESSSMIGGNFYFNPSVTLTDQEIVPAPPPPQNTPTPEIVFWQSIQNSQVVSEYEAYLSNYPEGDFVSLANSRIASLELDIPVVKPAPSNKSIAADTSTNSDTGLAQEITDPGRAVLILDASGSMWGQIDGKAKIEIAREAIISLVTEMGEDVQLGLTAYGHNRKGDCGDIENLISAGPDTGKQIVSIINNIKPKGKTPLSEAVRQTAYELKFTEEKASVILLSDGLETCNDDPCAVARELEESGVDFVVHVIGFDLTQEERQSLQCIADETGGQFLAAGDARTLATALLTAVKQVSIPTVSANTYTTIRPYLTESGERLNGLFHWALKNETGEIVLEQRDFHIVEKVPSGKYTVIASQLNALGEMKIEIDQNDPQNHKIEINGGTLNLRALGEDGEAYENEDYIWWTLFTLDKKGKPAKEYLTKVDGINETFLLAPGKYLVSAEAGLIGGSMKVQVYPGQVTDAPLILTSGRLILTAMVTEDGKKYDGGDYVWWSVFPINQSGQVARKYIAKDDGVVETFDLAPGRYQVVAEAGVLGAQLEVNIIANETVEQIALLESGRLIMTGLSTAGGEKFDGVNYLWWSVYPIDDRGKVSKKYISKEDGVVEEFDLAPGRYLVNATAGEIEAEIEVTIVAGETLEVSLPLEAGILTMTALTVEGGEKFKGQNYLWWSIYPINNQGQASKKYIEKEDGSVESFDLPPGRYLAVAEAGPLHAQTEVTVVAGETTEKSLSMEAAWVEFTALGGDGNKYDGGEYVWWSIFPKGKKKYIDKEDGVVERFDLNTGDYTVKIEVGDDIFESEFSISAGERRQISVILDGL